MTKRTRKMDRHPITFSDVDPETRQQFKAWCATHGVSMSSAFFVLLQTVNRTPQDIIVQMQERTRNNLLNKNRKLSEQYQKGA